MFVTFKLAPIVAYAPGHNTNHGAFTAVSCAILSSEIQQPSRLKATVAWQ